MESNSLHNQFIKFIKKNNLFEATDKLLLAFSGGIDSVVLADLLIKSRYNFELAHCNFQLRAKESDRDEKFAIAFADKNSIPIHTQRFDTKLYAYEQKISIQEAARQLRYAFFEKIAQELHFDKILTAHHLDDNIETLFINLNRGTGIKGLCGIPLKNKLIVRPLLFATREQIQNHTHQNNLKWCEDSSNLSDKYTRNNIRHHIIPLFKSQNKNFYAIYHENIQRFNESTQLLNSLANEKMNKYISYKNEQIIVDLKKLKQFELSASLLFHFAQNMGFNIEQVKSIIKQSHQSGKIYLSQNYKAYIDREKLIFVPLNHQYQKNEFCISPDTSKLNFPISLTFKCIDYNNDITISGDSSIAYIDSSTITFPLILRKWKPGDRFYPIGMKKTKKISDFLTDLKISRYDKENTWVLTSNDQIVWVVGYRIDNRNKITEKTKKILKIKFKP